MYKKINDKIIIGRGVPKEWITANQTFSVSNHVVEQGKKVGYAVQTSPDGKEVTITFTGDQTTIPFSVELINFKNNKCDCRTNQPLPPVSRIAVNVRTISSI